jgi:adenylate kinase
MTRANQDHRIEEIKSSLGAGSINIFGMPFAGKDTLAHNLSSYLDGPVISGGDILRSHPDQATIKKLMQTGELFPTDYYMSIILPYISQNTFAGRPLILSSVGRWSGEEPTIMQACEEAGHPMRAVIHLHVEPEIIWQRFEVSQSQQDRSHRHDDAAHILEVRLKEYREKTLPVLEYYRRQNLLIEMDGHKRIEDTTQDALDHMYNFLKARS